MLISVAESIGWIIGAIGDCRLKVEEGGREEVVRGKGSHEMFKGYLGVLHA